jgi:hypothetical protein
MDSFAAYKEHGFIWYCNIFNIILGIGLKQGERRLEHTHNNHTNKGGLPTAAVKSTIAIAGSFIVCISIYLQKAFIQRNLQVDLTREYLAIIRVS